MKTIATTSAVIALAIALTACGSKKQPEPQPTAATTAVAKPAATPAKPEGPKKPLTEVEVKEFHQTFEKAMSDIPPELRADFQKLFQCEVTKNNKLPPASQANIDGDWVVQKTAELKANRALANCS